MILILCAISNSSNNDFEILQVKYLLIFLKEEKISYIIIVSVY